MPRKRDGEPTEYFLRASNGTFISFDANGNLNYPNLTATFPHNINPAGAITGFYYDANTVAHGFLRAPDGTLATFDASGVGTGAVSKAPMQTASTRRGRSRGPT